LTRSRLTTSTRAITSSAISRTKSGIRKGSISRIIFSSSRLRPPYPGFSITVLGRRVSIVFLTVFVPFYVCGIGVSNTASTWQAASTMWITGTLVLRDPLHIALESATAQLDHLA
jgi:hypothetical protein